MVLSPGCRVVVRGGMNLGRLQVCAAAHVGGRLICTAVVSSQGSLQDVMSRLAAFRAHARRDFKDEYLRKAARSLRAVVPVSHRRGLPPLAYVASALLGRVDARRLS